MLFRWTPTESELEPMCRFVGALLHLRTGPGRGEALRGRVGLVELLALGRDLIRRVLRAARLQQLALDSQTELRPIAWYIRSTISTVGTDPSSSFWRPVWAARIVVVSSRRYWSSPSTIMISADSLISEKPSMQSSPHAAFRSACSTTGFDSFT
uniref:Uncharacterized protein n=1 Tax=Anopheles dirus TaxID=7168 RepID=A0A182NW11_9DIPT